MRINPIERFLYWLNYTRYITIPRFIYRVKFIHWFIKLTIKNDLRYFSPDTALLIFIDILNKFNEYEPNLRYMPMSKIAKKQIDYTNFLYSEATTQEDTLDDLAIKSGLPPEGLDLDKLSELMDKELEDRQKLISRLFIHLSRYFHNW